MGKKTFQEAEELESSKNYPKSLYQESFINPIPSQASKKGLLTLYNILLRFTCLIIYYRGNAGRVGSEMEERMLQCPRR